MASWLWNVGACEPFSVGIIGGSDAQHGAGCPIEAGSDHSEVRMTTLGFIEEFL